MPRLGRGFLFDTRERQPYSLWVSLQHMSHNKKFTITHRDEFEKDGKWFLVRRSLGVQSFGMNMVEIKPGESIPEHDEIDRDQEEVFIVLKGNPTMVIDKKEYPVKEGTYIRVDPEPKRTIVNKGKETAEVLIVSAPRTSGYTPMSWA